MAKAVEIDDGGRIVVAGYYNWSDNILPPPHSTFTQNVPRQFAVVARLKPDGSLDASFGDRGKTAMAVNYSSAAHAMKLHPDGSIVLGLTSDQFWYRLWDDGGIDGIDVPGLYIGRASLVQIRSNGRLDRDFGLVPIDKPKPFWEDSVPFEIELDGEGRWVVASTGYARVFNEPVGVFRDAFTLVSRVVPDADGQSASLDPDFGRDGVYRDLSHGGGRSLELLADGRVLLAHGLNQEPGYPLFGNGTGQRFAVSRLTADGRLDRTYGTSGTTYLDVRPFPNEYLRSFDHHSPFNYQSSTGNVNMELDAEERLVFVAHTTLGDPRFQIGTSAYYVARLNANGAPDPNFGTDGSLTFQLRSPPNYLVRDHVPPVYGDDPFWQRVASSGPWDMELQPDGKIVMVANAWYQDRVAIFRLLPEGEPPPASATVIGRIYDDADGDGRFEHRAGERSLAGAALYVDLDRDGFHDASEPTFTTNARGVFRVSLPAGRYQIRPLTAGGQRVSRPGKAYYTLNLDPGEVVKKRHFGLTASGSLAGVVFFDRDADGVWDSNERGRRGLRLFLDLDNDGRRDRGERVVRTRDGGRWRIDGLEAGRYVVLMLPAKKWQPGRKESMVAKLRPGQLREELLFGVRRIV